MCITELRLSSGLANMRRYISQAHRHIAITQLREVEASNVTENACLPVLRLWSVQMVHPSPWLYSGFRAALFPWLDPERCSSVLFPPEPAICVSEPLQFALHLWIESLSQAGKRSDPFFGASRWW